MLQYATNEMVGQFYCCWREGKLFKSWGSFFCLFLFQTATSDEETRTLETPRTGRPTNAHLASCFHICLFLFASFSDCCKWRKTRIGDSGDGSPHKSSAYLANSSGEIHDGVPVQARQHVRCEPDSPFLRDAWPSGGRGTPLLQCPFWDPSSWTAIALPPVSACSLSAYSFLWDLYVSPFFHENF